MEVEMFFVGFNRFVSKKNDRPYYVLKFLTEPVLSQDGEKCDAELISIFVEDADKYIEFVESNKIFSKVPVKVVLNGSMVRYSI